MVQPHGLLIEVRNRVGQVILDRASALNALNLSMVRALHQQLLEWEDDPEIVAVTIRSASEKVFCAGGDIRQLYASYRAGDGQHAAFFREEYRLDHYLHGYKKPVLALVDGLVLGGGMGVVQAASLRIVTERARLGMPEVSIGFFPDVGATHFLSRLPGHLGEYLGVSGNQIGAADAIYSGLADHCIQSHRLADLEAAFDHQVWHDPAPQISALLGKFSAHDIAGGELHLQRTSIDACFSQPDVASICSALQREASAWAAHTLDTINTRSPLAMALTLEALRRGRALDLAGCFALEAHLARQLFEHGDFIEGVRALIIDKDNTPRWDPPTIAQLIPARVQAFFNRTGDTLPR